MSSINDTIRQNQRDQIVENSREEAHKTLAKTEKAQATQQVKGVNPSSTDEVTTPNGQPPPNVRRPSGPAPLPGEPRYPAANDGGHAVGQTMGTLAGTGNVGDMTLEAQELNVGYKSNERTTNDQDKKMQTDQQKAQDKAAQEKEQKAAQAEADARHAAEALMIATCPLVGIIMTAVMETEASKKGAADKQNDAHEKQQEAQQQWGAATPGANGQNTQGQVTTIGPDGQPVVPTNGPQQPSQPQSPNGNGGPQRSNNMHRPAPNSPAEHALFQAGQQHMAAASATLTDLPATKKVSQYGY